MKKPIILTIDDDVDFNNLLKVVLKPLDVELITSQSAKDFTDKFKSNKPNLCIIDLNLDIAMGAGYQLIQALRKTSGHDVPIIVLSRRSSKEDISLALEVGANDALSKPLDPPLLISKIKQHLGLDGKKNELTYYSISESKRECTIDFNLNMAEISEYGLTLCSPHLVTKGTSVILKGSIINEIFHFNGLSIMITETSFSSEDSLFYAYCEFDSTREELSRLARQWILKNRTL
ncbi:MAG: hypothetical protein Fur0010_07950 [Bdellovibrio sp.]